MDGSGAHLVFWISALIVLYPYAVYPALMLAISRLRRPPRVGSTELPSISVVVAAFNEAEWIERKLDSALTQDYPPERLEVVVVSDGSTDATADLVSRRRDERVRLIVQDARRGKSAALNVGVRASRGDVLVFTDANALFAPGALRKLAEHFADPRVGLVSGQGLYGELGDGAARAVANSYVRLEALIKSGESRLGILGGADGAIYAMRRHLYEDLSPAQVNDLLHPFAAALSGYRSRFEPDAHTVEPPSHGAGEELERHVRIIAQGYALTAELVPRLLARGRGKEIWVLVSHRLLRWVSALGLLGVLIASLLASERPFFRLALAAQGLFYAAAVWGWLAERRRLPVGLAAAPYYFSVVSLAGVLGLLRFLRGGAQAVWSPRGVRRPPEPAPVRLSSPQGPNGD